jgi:hypothetical protein
MTKRERKPKLSDILIAKTPIQGVGQLAVYLAKKAKLKNNPATEAVVIWFYENGEPDIVWSELDAPELDTLRRYFDFVVEDVFREQWYDQLSHPDDDDSAV